MKKKQLKSKRRPAAMPSSATCPEPAVTAAPSPIVNTVNLDFPPQDVLAQAAMKEPNRKLIQNYIETIQILRKDKGFSFREIADWLTENGVQADYNAVYRAYTKGMSDEEEREVAVAEAEREEG